MQVQYGAIILSFLGALHWGFEFAGYGGGPRGVPRYALGIAPVLGAWTTLLVPSTEAALVAQWAMFAGMWFADQRTTSWGWSPKWYSTVRCHLTSPPERC